jgi:hypothetical protein
MDLGKDDNHINETKPIKINQEEADPSARRRFERSDDEFRISRFRKWLLIVKLFGKHITISREIWACDLCKELLHQNELVVETSNFGERRITYVRFITKKLETLYESHLLEAHGMTK